jgi:hypothetical protein
VDEANGWIDFSWTPEDDFRQYILDGELDIVVDVNVSATDLLGHNAQLAVPISSLSPTVFPTPPRSWL